MWVFISNEAQLPAWAVASRRPLNSSTSSLIKMNGSRQSQGENVRVLHLWTQLLISVDLVWEQNRRAFISLVRQELQKTTDKMKQLLHDGHQPTRCLHPGARSLRRANQFAEWTVCQACQARTSYRSRRTRPHKGQGKGKIATASTIPPPLTAPLMAASPTPAASASSASSVGEIVERALLAMQVQSTEFGQAMSQIGASLQQLILMAQGQPSQPVAESASAARTPQVFDLTMEEEESGETWNPL